MNKKNITVSILFFIIGFLVCAFINSREEIIVKARDVVVRDTIVEYIEQEPLIIEKVKTKIQIKSDTIIKTLPFIASMDTVLLSDTIHASFEFPENHMSVNLRKGLDSIQVRNIEVIKTIKEEDPWWETPAYILSGTLLGYLLGGIDK